MTATSRYVEQLRAHFSPLLGEHGATSHRAVDWGSTDSQYLRFSVLLQALREPAKSVLDVGCGVGELVSFMEQTGYETNYLGIDPLAEMVEGARSRFPGRSFEVGLFGDGTTQPKADLVVASGIFTFADDDQMFTTIREMFDSCNRVLAFNALSALGGHRENGEFYRDPGAVFAFCRQLTPWVTLRHDYMPHDFTVYLYREQNR